MCVYLGRWLVCVAVVGERLVRAAVVCAWARGAALECLDRSYEKMRKLSKLLQILGM